MLASTLVPGDEEQVVAYGGRGRDWHPKFIEYMQLIIENPQYAGIPCVYKADGLEFDWTIPSFRAEGSHNWDGNQRRREWWSRKADELGIEQTGHWISRVAKTIHPGWKPCQVCGREMLIAYAYPQAKIIDRLNDGLPEGDQLHHHDLLTIWEIMQHVSEVVKDERSTVKLLCYAIPKLREYVEENTPLDIVSEVVSTELVPNEYGGFSPGTMANPPDRLDGFHTYNLCCRSKQDTGRSQENLRSYGVDRRAFEQWAEGDWGLANRLMSVIGTEEGSCAHVGYTCPSQNPTLLTADHIGPISLGFKHAAAFALLCRSCNSAKNNRMSLQDVDWLRELEDRDGGWSAASWHAHEIWEALRDRVQSNDDVLLLSKCLRTNQHVYLTALAKVVEVGAGGALVNLLNLEPAETRVEVRQSAIDQLDGARIVHLTASDYVRVRRQASYAESLKGRLIRIAFESLEAYGQKVRRNVRLDEAAAVGGLSLERELGVLGGAAISVIDETLEQFNEELEIADPDLRESALRALVADGLLADLTRPEVIQAIADFQNRVAEAMVLVFEDRRPLEPLDIE